VPAQPSKAPGVLSPPSSVKHISCCMIRVSCAYRPIFESVPGPTKSRLRKTRSMLWNECLRQMLLPSLRGHFVVAMPCRAALDNLCQPLSLLISLSQIPSWMPHISGLCGWFCACDHHHRTTIGFPHNPHDERSIPQIGPHLDDADRTKAILTSWHAFAMSVPTKMSDIWLWLRSGNRGASLHRAIWTTTRGSTADRGWWWIPENWEYPCLQSGS